MRSVEIKYLRIRRIANRKTGKPWDHFTRLKWRYWHQLYRHEGWPG